MKKSVRNPKRKYDGVGLGISGFTLILSGLVLFLFNPIFSFAMFVLGIIFCAIQQKRRKTKLGKIGLGLGIFGLILNIIYLWWIIKYIAPQLQNGSFPTN